MFVTLTVLAVKASVFIAVIVGLACGPACREESLCITHGHAHAAFAYAIRARVVGTSTKGFVCKTGQCLAYNMPFNFYCSLQDLMAAAVMHGCFWCKTQQMITLASSLFCTVAIQFMGQGTWCATPMAARCIGWGKRWPILA